jgi:hypothetical protein
MGVLREQQITCKSQEAVTGGSAVEMVQLAWAVIQILLGRGVVSGAELLGQPN